MANFDNSKGKRRNNSRNSSRRGNRFGDRPGKKSKSFDKRPRKRSLEMTKVTCDSCGEECEVPFRPTSSKPVYCSSCFTKKEKGKNSKSSEELDAINEKLDKIMKAMGI